MFDYIQHFSFQREMNQAFLQSEDFANAVMAQISKDEKPVFSKL